jgi:EAL domain-containing protein (putative c-di-GMP-specific phosphodiesterase class I)
MAFSSASYMSKLNKHITIVIVLNNYKGGIVLTIYIRGGVRLNSCTRCGHIPNLPDKGQLLVRMKEEHKMMKLITRLQHEQFTYIVNENDIFYIEYAGKEELLQLIEQLDAELLSSEEVQATYSAYGEEHFARFIPYLQLRERIMQWPLVKVINEGLFTQHIQPVIKLQTNDVYGYEFLVRSTPPHLSFNPGSLFSFSQKAGLQSILDSQARISSIEISAKLLENGMKRFINFLPSSIYDPAHCLKSTLKAVERHQVRPEDLVFEVVETEKIHDVNHLKKIFTVYQSEGIHVALDDLGAGFATVEVLKELKPNFAKIDRAIIDYCDQNETNQAKIKEIVSVADAYGITLLAEGIERKEEAEFCLDINIPLAQGYYFGRPQKNPVTNVYPYAN